MFRKNDEKPSELGTPSYTASIWKAIRKKNQEREREHNRGTPPRVVVAPEGWALLVCFALATHHSTVVHLIFG